MDFISIGTDGHFTTGEKARNTQTDSMFAFKFIYLLFSQPICVMFVMCIQTLAFIWFDIKIEFVLIKFTSCLDVSVQIANTK